ncbi:MAG: bifunctional nuclease family protein [Nitrospirae bacterium]|nr:bifunctional nuclease family protein [Candidatus Manganitrophaceae bacterium]
MNIPLKVHAVISDPNTEAQIVILKDEQNIELLPIWVGMTEGNAIRFAMEGIVPQRPLTHDLLKDILGHLGAQIEKVVIHDLNNNTYFATLYLLRRKSTEAHAEEESGEPFEMTIDARPSDAIALALRARVPIYVTEEVLRRKSSENLDEWLERLKPKDIGPYNA